MLAVGVERQDRLGPVVQGVGETVSQGRTLALVGLQPQHLRAGGFSHRRRIVGGTIVDHHHRQVLPWSARTTASSVGAAW